MKNVAPTPAVNARWRNRLHVDERSRAGGRGGRRPRPARRPAAWARTPAGRSSPPPPDLGEAIDDRGHPGREQEESRRSRRSRGCGRARGSSRAASAMAKRADRDVHEEDPAPARVLHEQPRRRPGRGRARAAAACPRTPITRPTRAGPAARVSSVMPTGMIMPPPIPCRTRKPIRLPSDQAAPESIEPARNRPTDAIHTRLPPKRSVAHPASGITLRARAGNRSRPTGRW